MMIKLNSNHIPANIDKATKVIDKTGKTVDDLTQLKDHEILTNTKINELTTVQKSSTSEDPDTYIIKDQIKDTIQELIAEGYIQTINCLGVKMSTDLGSDDVTCCGNITHIPFSVTEGNNGEMNVNPGNWTDSFIEEFFGIKLCTINKEGKVIRYLNPQDFTNYYLPTETRPLYNNSGYSGWHTDFNPNDEDLNGEYIMIEIPRIYTKKYIENGMLYLFMSRDESVLTGGKKGWKLHPAFLSEGTAGKTYADKIYISKQFISIDSNGKLQIGGSSNNRLSYKQMYKKIKELNSGDIRGWEMMTYSKYSLLYEMYLLTAQKKSMFYNYLSNCSISDIYNITWDKNIQSRPSLITSKEVSINDKKIKQTIWMGLSNIFNQGTPVLGLIGKKNSSNISDENICNINLKMAPCGPYLVNDIDTDTSEKIWNENNNYKDIPEYLLSDKNGNYSYTELNKLSIENDLIIMSCTQKEYNANSVASGKQVVEIYNVSNNIYYSLLLPGRPDLVCSTHFYPLDKNILYGILATFS